MAPVAFVPPDRSARSRVPSNGSAVVFSNELRDRFTIILGFLNGIACCSDSSGTGVSGLMPTAGLPWGGEHGQGKKDLSFCFDSPS